MIDGIKMRTLIIKVVGVTFEGRQAVIGALIGNEPVRLEPEPTNPYDPNAIAVLVAFPPESGYGIEHVGYVPRELAAYVAPALEGEPVIGSIDAITGGFETFDGGTAFLGLQIKVEVPESNGGNYAD